jgi:nicotinamidase-related amidase
MKILRENTIAVVVDMQDNLLPHMHEEAILLRNSARLIDGLKVLGIPFLITQQYTRGLGNSHPKILRRLTDIRYIEKISFSCCNEPQFISDLKKSGKRDVILLGIESHVCVLQTCLDLMAKGFVAVVVSDCISSRNQNDKTVAIERMRQEGAVITTYESILFELTSEAGTDTFREVSKIVK